MEDVIMATITKDTIVGDILDIAPETAPAFIDIGMHCPRRSGGICWTICGGFW